MSMSGSNMSSIMEALGIGSGFAGSGWGDNCDAVGIGTIDALIGLAFTTTDNGNITGAGSGSGIGVLGVDSSALSNAILSAMATAFGQAGPDLADYCDAAAQSLAAELALATLTSTHGPVYAGSGNIDVGSLMPVGTLISSGIFLEGVAAGLLGDSWADVADVIGPEFADEISASGTGTVTITITSGPVDPQAPASPGIGSGSIS